MSRCLQQLSIFYTSVRYMAMSSANLSGDRRQTSSFRHVTWAWNEAKSTDTWGHNFKGLKKSSSSTYHI